MIDFPHIREIRQRYSLSQVEFAALLNISRSHLTMAENGRRALCSHSFNKLVELEKASNTISAEKKTLDKIAQKCTGHFHLLKLEWKRRLELIDCQKRVIEVQLKQIKGVAVSSLIAANHIHKLIQAAPSKTTPLPLLRKRQHLTENKHIACSATAQLKLQVKIDLLSAEAEILNRYLKDA